MPSGVRVSFDDMRRNMKINFSSFLKQGINELSLSPDAVFRPAQTHRWCSNKSSTIKEGIYVF